MEITARDILSCQDDGFLMEVYHQIKRNPVEIGRLFFPDRPRRYTKATQQIGNYAINKAIAIRCLRGNEMQQESAKFFFDLCSRIEGELPNYAK